LQIVYTPPVFDFLVDGEPARTSPWYEKN